MQSENRDPLAKNHLGKRKNYNYIKDRRTLSKVLDSITKVEPTFGKPYFKLEIDAAELDNIREEFNGK